jgi:hypothetical protein
MHPRAIIMRDLFIGRAGPAEAHVHRRLRKTVAEDVDILRLRNSRMDS